MLRSVSCRALTVVCQAVTAFSCSVPIRQSARWVVDDAIEGKSPRVQRVTHLLSCWHNHCHMERPHKRVFPMGVPRNESSENRHAGCAPFLGWGCCRGGCGFPDCRAGTLRTTGGGAGDRRIRQVRRLVRASVDGSKPSLSKKPSISRGPGGVVHTVHSSRNDWCIRYPPLAWGGLMRGLPGSPVVIGMQPGILLQAF